MMAANAHLTAANRLLVLVNNLNARLRHGLGMKAAAPAPAQSGDVYVWRGDEVLAWWDESRQVGIIDSGRGDGRFDECHSFDLFELALRTREDLRA